LVIDFGSEFQTVGAECRKARFANSVLVKGLISSGTSDKRNVRAGWRNVIGEFSALSVQRNTL